MTSQMRLLSKITINLQFHTYLPRVEKESDFRNTIIGFQTENREYRSHDYPIHNLPSDECSLSQTKNNGFRYYSYKRISKNQIFS